MHAKLNNMKIAKEKSSCQGNTIEMPKQSLSSMTGQHLTAVPYVSFWGKKIAHEPMFVIKIFVKKLLTLCWQMQ